MPLRRAMGLVAALTVLALLGSHVAGLAAGLEHLAPALLLGLPLAWGRYVGEDRIAVLARAARGARRPRPRARLRARLPRAPRATVSRGGRLIAASLAERGPPAGLVAAR